MKKIIIALAAVTTLAAGASAAQAKVNFDVYLGGFGGHDGYGHGYYEPIGYDDECHYVTKKKVFWKHGHKVVKYKKVLVCNSY